jgi:hypothetical protein
MAWRGHETWYRAVGELEPDAAQTPVVICHGGPGAARDYCEPIADLSRSGLVPMPDCVARTFVQIAANPTVYHAMNGPSGFHVVGSLMPHVEESEAFLSTVEAFLRTID